jgi:Zn-dependent protease
VSRCAHCGTELPVDALSCPVCGTLVHAERLKELAATAERQSAAGELAEASASWRLALERLPEGSQQHAIVSGRIAELAKRVEAKGPAAPDQRPWYRRGAAAVVALALFALGKLKFLLLGLGKASTFFSMFAFFGVYWTAFGWPLALGLVVSIYIHEMGHVWELRRNGIPASAPLFIPGLGALVLLKKHVDDPRVDARIGLAGPVWGLAAGLMAYAIFVATGQPIWGAIAHLTGFINLFNLIPVWQLDGSRGFHALSRWQRWGVVATIALAYYVTDDRMLLLVGAVAVWRALERPANEEGDTYAFATFVVLVGALAWLSTVRGA